MRGGCVVICVHGEFEGEKNVGSQKRNRRGVVFEWFVGIRMIMTRFFDKRSG